MEKQDHVDRLRALWALDITGNLDGSAISAAATSEDEWLRGGPVRRWVPRGLEGKPVFVFETGGTTGTPKTRVACDDFRTDYELFSATLPDEITIGLAGCSPKKPRPRSSSIRPSVITVCSVRR